MTAHDNISKSLARGTRPIGVMVYWTGLTNASIARPLWHQGLRIAGIAEAVGKDPKPDAMLNQATQMAQRKQGRGDERVALKLASKGQDATYRVMVPRPMPDGRARTIEEATIAVDCYATNPPARVTMVPDTDPHSARDAVIESVVDWYGEIQANVFTSEISDALVEIMEYLGAVTLRTGVYFVHAANADRVKAVKRFIELSTTAHVTAWNINGDDENADEARQRTKETFLERLDALVVKVQEFTTKTTPDDALPRSVNAKVREFKKLDGEVELWADILGDYATQLRESVAAAKQNLLGAYLGLADDDSTTTDDTSTTASNAITTNAA